MSFSDYLEGKVLGHVFGGVPYSAPSTIYVALLTSSPTDAGAGVEVSTSSTGYARVAVTPSTGMTISGSNPTQIANVNTISFATATASWGTITHAGIYDAATGGNLLDWSALASSKTIGAGDSLSFNPGSLKITLD